MKLRKRLGALLCALALLVAVGVRSVASAATPTIYLLAVNDIFYDQYLPVSVDGVIYVPYTVFDRNATKVDLGVYYGISPLQGTTLTLYSVEGMLVFKVNMGICEDGEGNRMSFHAVFRGPNNTVPYVPAAAVCSFFGLTYSYLPTADRGTLIRIASGSVSMTDDLFMKVVPTAMKWRYDKVLQSMTPAPTPTPTPTATPVPTVTTPPSRETVTVYLALEAWDAEGDLLGQLPADVRVLLLFTPDSLTAHADLVRRAVAVGHSVGLAVEGETEEVLADLERGNELLRHIARVRTRIAAAPAELTETLTEAGWACWQEMNVREGHSRATLSAGADRLAEQIWSLYRNGDTILRQPLETDLG